MTLDAFLRGRPPRANPVLPIPRPEEEGWWFLRREADEPAGLPWEPLQRAWSAEDLRDEVQSSTMMAQGSLVGGDLVRIEERPRGPREHWYVSTTDVPGIRLPPLDHYVTWGRPYGDDWFAAWHACPRGSWLLSLVEAVGGLPPHHLGALLLAVADAALALPLYGGGSELLTLPVGPAALLRRVRAWCARREGEAEELADFGWAGVAMARRSNNDPEPMSRALHLAVGLLAAMVGRTPVQGVIFPGTEAAESFARAHASALYGASWPVDPPPALPEGGFGPPDRRVSSSAYERAEAEMARAVRTALPLRALLDFVVDTRRA